MHKEWGDNVSKKIKYNIIISIILIVILIISSVLRIISWATDETGVAKVTDEA